MPEAKPQWVQKFWGHVMGDLRLVSCRAALLCSNAIVNDSSDSEVSEARDTVIGDQDVSLGR